MSSQEIYPSIGWKHARYGDGVYLTDINMAEYSIGSGSAYLYRVPWNTQKLTHYVEIDITGLNVIKNPVPFNFYVPTTQPLPIIGRVVSSGNAWWKGF